MPRKRSGPLSASADRPVILHLSDIQFGLHHRFSAGSKVDQQGWGRYSSPADFQTLQAKLEADLKLLKETEGVKPNILVISGDIAEWSTTEEYEWASTFISELLQTQYADFSRDRLLLVPGNHDVNWDLCEAYFSRCKAYRKEPEPPYADKFEFWDQFFEKVTGRRPGEKPWTGYDFSHLGLAVVGLNSVLRESHREDGHYGWIGLLQATEVNQWLNEIDPGHRLVHIAILHHNVFRGSALEEESLRDWDEVRPLFEQSIDIVLHGHRHQAERNRLGQSSGPGIVILGAGSAGLDGSTLPSCPNQYQLLAIDRGRALLYLRRYAEEQTGVTGKGQFVPDVNADGNWKYTMPLTSVVAAPLRREHKRKSADAGFREISTYLSFSKESISRRLSLEREKVDDYLDLHCRYVRENSVALLKEEIETWLSDKSQQLLLLGAAGSGKTIACLNVALTELKCWSTDRHLPVYLDLGRYAAFDDALEILKDHFRVNGCILANSDIIRFMKSTRTLVILDAFDEYDKSGAISASDRTFDSFGVFLTRADSKVLITCRSNFFRRIDDVFIYDLRAQDFQICPANAAVLEVLPLGLDAVRGVLLRYIEESEPPNWLLRLADRPLYLRMLIGLLKAHVLDLTQDLPRHQLYERFVDYGLKWDVLRSDTKVTLRQSRELHVRLAQRMLTRGTTSLDDIELFQVIEEMFPGDTRSDDFRTLAFFFKESGFLRFEGGRLVFVHKSFREYLIGRRIFEDILLDDDQFEFTWFTRNERDFIIEMLGEAEKATLRKWLKHDSAYPARNYAAFILGGTGDSQMRAALRDQLSKTEDPLLRINILNALAALGDSRVRPMLSGIISGYALDENLLTMPPSGADTSLFGALKFLSEEWGRSVMLIHLCETIEALAQVGDETAVNLLRRLERARDKSVAEEARVDLYGLRDRLGMLELQ